MMFVYTLLALLAGMFTWSFLEYAMHHWYGHIANGRNHFSREHLKHHAQAFYFSPTRQKLVFAGLITAVVLPVSMLAWGPVIGGAFTVGLVGAYAGYEWLHHRIHVAAPRTKYTRWSAHHHFSHHFACPKKNHGVTSPLWDYVFGTYQKPPQLRVPKRRAMPWLIDPNTGEVRAEYSDNYQLR